MRLQIAQNNEFIEVVPSIYKDMEKPPKFIFRSPNSVDCLDFMFGGYNAFNAACNLFIGFENKIELVNGDKEIKYNDYREFIMAGVAGDIALIHNECMDAITKRLGQMINEAQTTEKKSQSPTNSGKKGQEDKMIIQEDSKTNAQ